MRLVHMMLVYRLATAHSLWCHITVPRASWGRASGRWDLMYAHIYLCIYTAQQAHIHAYTTDTHMHTHSQPTNSLNACYQNDIQYLSLPASQQEVDGEGNQVWEMLLCQNGWLNSHSHMCESKMVSQLTPSGKIHHGEQATEQQHLGVERP